MVPCCFASRSVNPVYLRLSSTLTNSIKVSFASDPVAGGHTIPFNHHRSFRATFLFAHHIVATCGKRTELPLWPSHDTRRFSMDCLFQVFCALYPMEATERLFSTTYLAFERLTMTPHSIQWEWNLQKNPSEETTFCSRFISRSEILYLS